LDVVATNEDHVIKVKEMFSNYQQVFGFEHIEPSFTLKITNSIQDDIYFYSSKEDKILMDKYGLTSSPNGTVILPSDTNLHFVVLIDEIQFFEDEADPYIHTVFHEFTHLYDYYFYCMDFGNVHLLSNEIKNIKYFWDIYYWSEFHAKRIGSYLYIKYLEEKFKVAGIKLDFQTENLVDNINRSKTMFFQFQEAFTELMSYLGRLSVFHENSTICPDPKFPKDFLIQTFGEEIFDLYALLLDMNDYQTAKNRLIDFKDIKDRILRNKF